MTSHSDKSLINLDRIKRDVYCRNCNIHAFTKILEPTCPVCGEVMITTIKSVITKDILDADKK